MSDQVHFVVPGGVKSGVNVSGVKVYEWEEKQKMPAVALIPVDQNGSNQIYVLPGINEDFCAEHVDQAEDLFVSASQNDGFLVLTLELPLQVALYSAQKAKSKGIRVILDPGGIQLCFDYFR